MIKEFSQIRAKALITLAALALALALFPLPTLGFELPKFLVLSSIATLTCYVFIARREDVLSPFIGSLYGTLYYAFFAICILSLLWSVAPLASLIGVAPRFQGVLTLMCFCILGIGAARLSLTRKGRGALLTALISANAVTVLYGFLQMMRVDPLAVFWDADAFLGRVFSTIGHPNALGQFIVLSVPFVALMLTRTQHRASRLALGLLLILNGAVLLATVSRSALLGAGVLCALSVLPVRRFLAAERRRITLGQSFALSLLVVLGTSVGFLFFAERFSHAFEIGRSSAARALMWGYLGQMIDERPIGWGLETLAFTTPKFTGADIYAYESLTTVIDRAHNELVQLVLTLGPLGLFVFALLLLLLLHAAWKCTDSADLPLLKVTAAGICAYMATVMFGFPTIATGALFWVCFGICIGLLPVTQRHIPDWKHAVMRYVLAGFALGALFVSLQWVQARYVHAYARQLMQKDYSLALAVHREGLLTFGYDRESLIEVAQAHLQAMEQHPAQINRKDINRMIVQLRSLTGNEDGMADILEAWLAAIRRDKVGTTVLLRLAANHYSASIPYHRAAEHILTLAGDEAGAVVHKEAVRELLPEGYFESNSEMRRIHKKQHPWVVEYE